tara:strand:- start:119 stop:820 length:702 start_codon:yes stop_codon:yes gene_type:complete
MIRQSINKPRIYFYLLILLFLSTSLNLNYVLKFSELNLIKNIKILGLNNKEEKLLFEKLKTYKNKNIFLIKKAEIFNILSTFTFLEEFSIQRVLPSKIVVKAKKTNFEAVTILNGKKFYIGSNGKLIPVSHVTDENNLPFVFGKFSVDEFLNLQKLLVEQKINLNSIKRYFYHKGKRWDIENDKGTLVMLPYKNLKSSLINYKSIIDNLKNNSSEILDFRIPSKIIITNEKKK